MRASILIFFVIGSAVMSSATTVEDSATRDLYPVCAPCWALFGPDYELCSEISLDWNPLNGLQTACTDTLILMAILFTSITIMIPTCIWITYLCIQRCRHVDRKYTVNSASSQA